MKKEICKLFFLLGLPNLTASLGSIISTVYHLVLVSTSTSWYPRFHNYQED